LGVDTIGINLKLSLCIECIISFRSDKPVGNGVKDAEIVFFVHFLLHVREVNGVLVGDGGNEADLAEESKLGLHL
jgi:hypothetical protein